MTSNTNPDSRYALFFAPADDSPLGMFGATVLRRTATDAEEWTNPTIPVPFEHTATWQACITKPAHYGFHATLQAPFQLAFDETEHSLLQKVAEFCAQQRAIPLTNLEPGRTHRFDALVFEDQPEEVKAFAGLCIRHFNKYCAPLTRQDIARRRKKALTARQTLQLEQYGYPYVFDDFDFHMTLSGNMPENENGYYLQWLTELFHQMVPETPILDRLSVFHQQDRSKAFIRMAEFPFPATT